MKFKSTINYIFSLLIILSIFIIFMFLISNFIKINLVIDNSPCDKTIYNKLGDRNIILRLDDIQAFAWKEIQISMINDALKRDKTLSLGVIPLNLLDDKELSNLLKKNKCNLEIILHGYDHSYEEFSNLNYSQADKKIKDGIKILNEIELNITTFIPPNNIFSNKTKDALINNNFKIISAGYWNSKYGFNVSTYNWEEKKLNDYKDVLKNCEKDLDNNKTCIIMMHPQDYLKNYSSYTKLLDGLDELNASVINFKDLNYNLLEND